jgi:hypothetical protein
MAWVVWEYTDSPRMLRAVLQVFVVGAFAVDVATIREFQAIQLAALVITDLRISAFGANPNEPSPWRGTRTA